MKSTLKTVGYSVTKSALKVMPKTTRSTRDYIQEFLRNDKYIKKVIRDNDGDRAQLDDGVQEALNEYFSGEPTKMFDTDYQYWKEREHRAAEIDKQNESFDKNNNET